MSRRAKEIWEMILWTLLVLGAIGFILILATAMVNTT